MGWLVGLGMVWGKGGVWTAGKGKREVWLSASEMLLVAPGPATGWSCSRPMVGGL